MTSSYADPAVRAAIASTISASTALRAAQHAHTDPDRLVVTLEAAGTWRVHRPLTLAGHPDDGTLTTWCMTGAPAYRWWSDLKLTTSTDLPSHRVLCRACWSDDRRRTADLDELVRCFRAITGRHNYAVDGAA